MATRLSSALGPCGRRLWRFTTFVRMRVEAILTDVFHRRRAICIFKGGR